VPTPDADRRAIRHIIQEINTAWRSGHTTDLNRYFHADMVIVGPGYQEFGRGREACVRSYEDFIRSAVIHECTESEPAIHVWGDTAVASYSWKMTYEQKGTVSREHGHDQVVFTREPDGWKAVWRMVTFAPQQA
jgi:uncharacterized protein (TIGR02246 family)